ncbi:MAG: hypothetical protein Q9P44_03920 [Anaerolineae bacterium]|nr:hypothetical protein [Anaerolineae bacterium]
MANNFNVTVQDDPKPPMPFSMIEGMMPMYPMIAMLGFLMVLIAVVVGYLQLAPAELDFFADAKAVREGADVGSSFVNGNVSRHLIEAWVPSFKLLGLGLGLMAINMALGIIAKRLRLMGKVVNAHMPENLRPAIPEIPKKVKVMQMLAMMGVMTLVITFIVSLVMMGVASSYWDNSIANTLNPAQAGSELLTQLGTLSSYNAWLAPLRIVGMGMLFTGILIALSVIIYNLRVQSELLVDFTRRAEKR